MKLDNTITLADFSKSYIDIHYLWMHSPHLSVTNLGVLYSLISHLKISNFA